MSADRDSGSEEGKKERLIILRDTGEDNEMVAVRGRARRRRRRKIRRFR